MIITYNDKRLNDLVYINNVKGLGLPPTKDIQVEFMNVSGSYYTGSMFEQRVVTLDCTIVQGSTLNIYQKLDNLKALINPLGGERRLSFSRYPGRHLNARVSGEVVEENIAMIMRLPISFYASDPLFYSDNQDTRSISTSISNPIANIGNVASSNWTIRGIIPVGMTNITNNTTGERLRLFNDTGATRNIEIDFKNGNITSGTQNANNMYMSGDFFELVPGINQVSINMNGTVFWRSAWL